MQARCRWRSLSALDDAKRLEAGGVQWHRIALTLSECLLRQLIEPAVAPPARPRDARVWRRHFSAGDERASERASETHGMRPKGWCDDARSAAGERGVARRDASVRSDARRDALLELFDGRRKVRHGAPVRRQPLKRAGLERHAERRLARRAQPAGQEIASAHSRLNEQRMLRRSTTGSGM